MSVSNDNIERTRAEKIAAIQALIAKGVTVKRACRDNGVARPTYYNWLKQLERDGAA